MDPKKFGAELRRIRKNERNMTMIEVADKADLTQGYLSLIENGHKGIPKPETITKLASALEVKPDELMFLAGYIKKDTYNEITQASQEMEKLSKKRALFENRIEEMNERIKRVSDSIARLEKEFQNDEDDENLSIIKRQELNKLNQEKAKLNLILAENNESFISTMEDVINKKHQATKEAYLKYQDDFESTKFLDHLDMYNSLKKELNYVTQNKEKVKSKNLNPEEEIQRYHYLLDSIKKTNIDYDKESINLHHLLTYEIEVQYAGKKLNKKEKEKILTMLQVIFY